MTHNESPVVPAEAVGYDFEQETSSSRVFPLRFFGMGLFVAWLCCTHISLVFPGPGCDLAARSAFDMGLRAGDIGTFIVLAIAARRIGVLSAHPSACFALVTLCSVGTAVCGLWLLPAPVPYGLVFGAAVPTAIGGALLFCLWGQVYCRMGMTQAIVDGALSCIAALIVSGVVSVMRQPFAVVATALLPLASIVAVSLCLRVLPAEAPADATQRYPLPWKLLAIMVIGSFLMGTSSMFMENADYLGSAHRILATGAFGVVVLGMAYLHRDKLDARTLALVALALALASLLCVPFAAGALGNAVSFMEKFAFIFFTFFVLLVIVGIVRRYSVPSLPLFAVTRACTELPLLAGLLFNRMLLATDWLDILAVRIALALAGVVLVLVCVLIWKSERSVNADWGAQGVGIATNRHEPGPQELFMARCDAMAERYGLTAREIELLALTLQGKTRAQIEQELYLSANTVKTHLRHAYGKLGVHSKAEVADLFETVR
ncbi:helix-turn-helix transcriptional regulator [uncultured Adlercreutzia sp.]|uniref:helix-turn-helix domain-containing protein n=1 Tax=uncultured Adlercreutzia sp. TaxID=875803 RepID=UPI0025DAFB37|nr:helix-turn-helix transcriptional regulator [uncultured Adlercreutzia sp.]